MTNSIAIGLFLLILLGLGLDHWLDRGIALSLGRRFVDLVQYVAFWR